MKPFSKTDWMGFSGAEPWGAGPELQPQIGEAGEAIIIADRNGVQVIIQRGDALPEQVFQLDCLLKEASIEVAELLESRPSAINKPVLLALGFEIIS